MNQQQRDEMHNAMMEDFSDVIAKHFPNFDNNIESQTWSFLVLFTEETIQQLGKELTKWATPANNAEMTPTCY